MLSFVPLLNFVKSIKIFFFSFFFFLSFFCYQCFIILFYLIWLNRVLVPSPLYYIVCQPSRKVKKKCVCDTPSLKLLCFVFNSLFLFFCTMTNDEWWMVWLLHTCFYLAVHFADLVFVVVQIFAVNFVWYLGYLFGSSYWLKIWPTTYFTLLFGFCCWLNIRVL